MKEASQRSRARWLRVALGVGVVVVAHALGGGSAQAASMGSSVFGTSRIGAAQDASAPGIVLAGLSSQKYPAFFKLSGDGKMLTIGAIALDLHCTSGAEFVVEDAFARVPVHPNGRMRARFSIPSTAGSNGEIVTGTDSFTARVNRKLSALSGSWQLHVSYSFTNGMSDQCGSGPVRFTAPG